MDTLKRLVEICEIYASDGNLQQQLAHIIEHGTEDARDNTSPFILESIEGFLADVHDFASSVTADVLMDECDELTNVVFEIVEQHADDSFD
jgi:hypothetical protein